MSSKKRESTSSSQLDAEKPENKSIQERQHQIPPKQTNHPQFPSKMHPMPMPAPSAYTQQSYSQPPPAGRVQPTLPYNLDSSPVAFPRYPPLPGRADQPQGKNQPQAQGQPQGLGQGPGQLPPRLNQSSLQFSLSMSPVHCLPGEQKKTRSYDFQVNQTKKGHFIPVSRKRNLLEVYTLGKELGKGGFSSVFACKHRELKEERAVKILKKKVRKDGTTPNWDIEMGILKEIDHPNIVKLYEVFETDDFIQIVQEYMLIIQALLWTRAIFRDIQQKGTNRE